MTTQPQTFTRAECQHDAAILNGILDGLDSIISNSDVPAPSSVYTLVQVAREKAGDLVNALDTTRTPKGEAGQ